VRKVFVLFFDASSVSILFSSIEPVKNEEYLASQKSIKGSLNYSIDYEHRFGDCWMQSMFFAALCRSVGIPARTSGGFRLFSGQLGSQFWAEFFLPSHGWIPVDTSADQLANYALNVTYDERKTFIDFFFANQESLRMIVQNSIDREPEEGPFDIQYPALPCSCHLLIAKSRMKIFLFLLMLWKDFQ